MSAEECRAYVSAMYDSPWWRKKVAKMSDAQVIAIALKEQQKALEKKNASEPEPPEPLF